MDGRNRADHQHKRLPRPFFSPKISCIKMLVRVPLRFFMMVGQHTIKNGEEECKISSYPTQENITPTLAEL